MCCQRVIGELVRVWVLSKREQSPLPTIFASIIVERLLDVLAAVAMLGIGLAIGPDLKEGPSRLLQTSGMALLLLVVVALGF